MISLEIFRLHARHNDVRNAFAALSRLNERYPNNPLLISRLGRYCLEIGRRTEAAAQFTLISDIISREKDAAVATGLVDKTDEVTDPLSNLLGSPSSTEDPKIEELIITDLFNQGFLHVYDGDFKKAVAAFRQV